MCIQFHGLTISGHDPWGEKQVRTYMSVHDDHSFALICQLFKTLTTLYLLVSSVYPICLSFVCHLYRFVPIVMGSTSTHDPETTSLRNNVHDNAIYSNTHFIIPNNLQF